jgi:hypothetical protein
VGNTAATCIKKPQKTGKKENKMLENDKRQKIQKISAAKNYEIKIRCDQDMDILFYYVIVF